VGTSQSTLVVTVDPSTGVVSMVCTPLSSIVLDTRTYNCGGTCWGYVTAVGLKPGAAINFYSSSGLFGAGTVASNGALSAQIGLSCGSHWAGVYVTSTAADGTAITSNTVDSPCG
jgi:hypothetical protein